MMMVMMVMMMMMMIVIAAIGIGRIHQTASIRAISLPVSTKKLKKDFRIFSFSLIMLSELSMKKTIPRRIIARIRPLCSVPVTWIVSWIVRFECIVWCDSVHRKNTGHIEISGTGRSPRHHTGGIEWLVLKNKRKIMSNMFLYEILTYHSI